MFFFAFPSWEARLTIFLCLWGPFIFFAVNGLFIFFPHFSIRLSSFFVLVCRTFLYCGYYSLITCLTNIFISVYRLCFIFNFLNDVFDWGKLYIFMGKSDIFFPLQILYFVCCLRKLSFLLIIMQFCFSSWSFLITGIIIAWGRYLYFSKLF